jgi:pSer/pThr/pTyr-binding forkhead associated (FHA) protein
MVDPRLNSIHLTDSRRVEYRRAREVLLDARGQRTLCLTDEPPADLRSQTIIDAPADQPAPDTYWLADSKRIYPLKIGVNTVGRSVDNDVVAEDGCVSRRHCAILVHASSGCELHDTASKNGTYVNGVRLAGPTRLRPGDEIQICEQKYVLRARSDAPSGPTGPDATFVA